MRIVPYAFAACLVAVPAAPALEFAVLHTGYRLAAERHEIIGERVRLFSADGGVIELPASAIASFEREPDLETEADVASETSPEPSQRSIAELVESLARELAIHPDLLHSVIAAESDYDPAAVSLKGAIGLMQLMPQTAKELAVDPWNAEQNLAGGTRYLGSLLERYAGRPDQLALAVAAYNAGPGAVDRYGGIPPYAETRAFVRRVLARFLRLSQPSSD